LAIYSECQKREWLKIYKWELMLTRLLGRPKNRWEDDIRNDMKKLKVKIGLAASRIAITGNYMLRRSKHSTTEVVAPKEEEEVKKFTVFYGAWWFVSEFTRVHHLSRS